MKIAGRTIVVTGGASGIGWAFAGHLAKLGARVVCLDRDSDAIEKARSSTPGEGNILFRKCDVGLEGDIVDAVQEMQREFTGIDVLINNAAILRDQTLVSKLGGTIRKHSFVDWQETLQSNLTGTFLASREVAAVMIENKSEGLIVNISSVSRSGNPGQSAYAASKSAIDALTRTWALELAPHRIRVVAIAPGFVETNMTKQIPAMFLNEIREQTPLKRFGSLEEFALTIQYVIENEYLNGTILEVDGGLRF